MVVVHPINSIKRLNPLTRKTIAVTSIVLAIALGSTAGWIALKRDQQTKLHQAQALLSQTCQSNFTANAQALQTARSQVSQATQALMSIPRLPVIGEPAAQKQLSNFAPCLQDLAETQQFFQAQELSASAFAIDGQTILPVTSWRSIETNLKQSIALLQTIPATSAIHEQAQKALVRSQTQLTQIQNRMQYEQEAVDALAQAQTLKQQVDRILQSSPDVNQLGEAEAKMQQAIDRLQSIPGGHTVSRESQTLLVNYQDQLAKVRYQNAISHLQPLLQEFQAFAQFVDALDIRSETEFHQYFDRLHSLQNQFDDLVQPSEPLRLHPATQTLETALTRYYDVSELWHQCHTGQCYSSLPANMFINDKDAAIDFRSAWWLPASYQIEGDSQSLVAKYDLSIVSNWMGRQFIQVNNAITTIWRQAESDIQTANQQLQSSSLQNSSNPLQE